MRMHPIRMPVFEQEMAWTPIRPHVKVFVVFKPATLPDQVLFGECVGFDEDDLALRLDPLPFSVILSRSNIAAILPLVPDWTLQADEGHAKLLAQVAKLWSQSQPVFSGPALEVLKQQYKAYVQQLGEPHGPERPDPTCQGGQG